jgi:hypothetical protein
MGDFRKGIDRWIKTNPKGTVNVFFYLDGSVDA